MLTSFATPVRTLVLAAALVFAAQMAEARADSIDQPQTTARSTARTKTDSKADTDPADRDGVPVGGILIIVGIVGVVILLAWVASRMGDNR
jgi:hypothetical protein